MSFSSSSESDQSDLRAIGYSFGHCFLAAVHMAQYLGDFWVWLDMVTNGLVGAAGNVAGCMNVKDASVCWVGITTDAAGWA